MDEEVIGMVSCRCLGQCKHVLVAKRVGSRVRLEMGMRDSEVNSAIVLDANGILELKKVLKRAYESLFSEGEVD